MQAATQTATVKDATKDTPEATTKAKRERKSFSVRLNGANNAQMRITATKRKDGAAQTYAVHTTLDGKKKVNRRGATEDHASIEAARKRVDVLVAHALKLGWKQREARSGFARKPDAFTFDTLPAPDGGAAPKASKKK
jgi:hypothetical protein